MKNPYLDGVLSIFDVAGISRIDIPQGNGLNQDAQKLLNDQNKLTNDYYTSTERLNFTP